MEEANRQAGNKPAVVAASARERARENFERALGEVLLFMGGHPLYEQMFLSEIRERVLPPLLKKQYKILRNGEGLMTGYASWAMVSEEVESRIKSGMEKGRIEINKDEWSCGDRRLVVDCVAGSEDGVKVLTQKIGE